MNVFANRTRASVTQPVFSQQARAVDSRPAASLLQQTQAMLNDSPQGQRMTQLAAMMANNAAPPPLPIQRKELRQRQSENLLKRGMPVVRSIAEGARSGLTHTAPVQLYGDEEKLALRTNLLKVDRSAGALVNTIIGQAEGLGSFVEEQVYALAESGKLMNLTGLNELLAQIEAAVRGDKSEEEKIRNKAGYVWELYYAVMAAGHDDTRKVQLGSVRTSEGKVGGDVVVYGSDGQFETGQIKLVTGAGKGAVKENIRKGIKQLGGSGGETADPQGRRIVDVTVVNTECALLAMSEEDRVAELKSYIYDVDCKNVDYVFVRFSTKEGPVKNYSFNAKDRNAPHDLSET